MTVRINLMNINVQQLLFQVCDFQKKKENVDDLSKYFFIFLVDDYDKDSPPRIIGSVPVHFQLTVTSIDEIDVMNQKIR